MNPADPDDPWPPLGRDPLRSLDCGACGWSGGVAQAAATAPGGDPGALGCPRCGEPVRDDPPSAADVRAARGGG